MKRATGTASGSLVFDKRRDTWNFYYYESGKRRSKLIGSRQKYPTKAAAWKAVDPHPSKIDHDAGPTVRQVVKGYLKEKMPRHYSSKLSYRAWLRNHILPRWGGLHRLKEVQPRPVQLWLDSLVRLQPRSRGHIRDVLRNLWAYAMFAGWVPIGSNPMELVTIKRGE